MAVTVESSRPVLPGAPGPGPKAVAVPCAELAPCGQTRVDRDAAGRARVPPVTTEWDEQGPEAPHGASGVRRSSEAETPTPTSSSLGPALALL